MKIHNSAPCRDCPDKGCGNHSNCEKYKEWYEEWEKKKAVVYGNRDKERLVESFQVDNVIKTVRAMNRRK